MFFCSPVLFRQFSAQPPIQWEAHTKQSNISGAASHVLSYDLPPQCLICIAAFRSTAESHPHRIRTAMAAALNAPALADALVHSQLLCGGCGQIRPNTGIRGAACRAAVCDACVVGLATCALLEDASRANGAWCIAGCGAGKACFTLPANADGVAAWRAGLPRDAALQAATTAAAAPERAVCEYRDACKKPATKVCMRCDSAKFCDACWGQAHGQSRKFATHAPQPLAAAGATATENCDKHALPRVWWSAEDGHLICLGCASASGKHAGHLIDQKATLLARIEAAEPGLAEAGAKAGAELTACARLAADIDAVEAELRAGVAAHKAALVAAVEDVAATTLAVAVDDLRARRALLKNRRTASTTCVAFTEHLQAAAGAVTAAVGAGGSTMPQLTATAQRVPASKAVVVGAEKSFAVPPTHTYFKLVDAGVAAALAGIKSALRCSLVPPFAVVAASCTETVLLGTLRRRRRAGAGDAGSDEEVSDDDDAGGAVAGGAAAGGAAAGGAAAGGGAAGGGAAGGGAVAGAAAAGGGAGVFQPERWTLRLSWPGPTVDAVEAAASGGFASFPCSYVVQVNGADTVSTTTAEADVPFIRRAARHIACKVRVVSKWGPYTCAGPEVEVPLTRPAMLRLWGGGGGGHTQGRAGGAGGFVEGKYLMALDEELTVTVGSGGPMCGMCRGTVAGAGCQYSSARSGSGGGATYVSSNKRDGRIILGAGGGGGAGGNNEYDSTNISGGGGAGTADGLLGVGGGGGCSGGIKPEAGSGGGGGGGATSKHPAPPTAGGGGSGGAAGCSGEHANGAGGQSFGGAGGGGGGAASHKHVVPGSFRAINATSSDAVKVPEEREVTSAGRGGSSCTGSAGHAIVILPNGTRNTFSTAGRHEVKMTA